ncbi:MAG: hypothetical protein WCG75_04980 [Armatimonadota bacterium]
MSVIAIAGLLYLQSPITLLYQPAIGSSYKSEMSVEQSGGPMGDSSTSMKTLVKVLSFADGYYKLQTTTSDVKVTGGPADTSEIAKSMEKESTTFVDKNFKFKLDTKGADKDAKSKEMMNGLTQAFSGVTFPAKPINIGDTWNNSIDMGALMKGMIPDPSAKVEGKVNLVYKLQKADETSVTIETTMSGTVNIEFSGQTITMKISGSGTSGMERATGTPLNSNSKFSMDMDIAGQTMAITQKITIKRI